MNLTEKYPILQHMGKEKKQMCQGSCSIGFLLDHKNLKIGVPNVERSFTCHQLIKLCQEVVNLKNEIDREEEARMFGEEIHTPSHIFFVH
jgi:3,4-dihydroxy-2-butanone 4-phosphate synthase